MSDKFEVGKVFKHKGKHYKVFRNREANCRDCNLSVAGNCICTDFPCQHYIKAKLTDTPQMIQPEQNEALKLLRMIAEVDYAPTDVMKYDVGEFLKELDEPAKKKESVNANARKPEKA